jgi:hypothetical protein
MHVYINCVGLCQSPQLTVLHNCAYTLAAPPSPTAAACADGSLMLNETELIRQINAKADFARVSSAIVRKIANFYDATASDVLAVCAMVAPNVLNPKVDLFKRHKLRVGKLDNPAANPPGTLTRQTCMAMCNCGFFIQPGTYSETTLPRHAFTGKLVVAVACGA